MKRYVSMHSAGSESYRPLYEVVGRTKPDPDEGPFYVRADEVEDVLARARHCVKSHFLKHARKQDADPNGKYAEWHGKIADENEQLLKEIDEFLGIDLTEDAP